MDYLVLLGKLRHFSCDARGMLFHHCHKPFRALYTCKSVLAAGFDNEADFSNLETWYDRDSRKVKIEAMGNGDAKLLHPALFIAAY